MAGVVRSTYNEFATNTSIHGLRYTIRGGRVARIFWCILMFLAISWVVYLMLLVYWRYSSSPISTYITTKWAPVSTISFPALTICNQNLIQQVNMENLVQNLTYPDEDKERLYRGLSSITSLIDGRYTKQDTSDLEWTMKLMAKNGYKSELEVYKLLSDDCSSMLTKCKWENKVVPCKSIFEESFTYLGRCCTFNGNLWKNRTNLKAKYFGQKFGLTAVVHYSNVHNTYSKFNKRVMQLIIHHLFDQPTRTDLSQIVSRHKVLFIQMKASISEDTSELAQLSIPKRGCLLPQETPKLQYPHYSDRNCLTSCKINATYDQCQCVPFRYLASGFPLCTARDVECLERAVFADRMGERGACTCTSLCSKELYEMFSSDVELYHNENSISRFLDDLDLEKSSVINFFFPTNRVTVYQRTLAADNLYLLSSLGGILGLVIGCSFTSLVEVIYYAVVRLPIKIMKLRQVFGQVRWINRRLNIYYDKDTYYK